MKRANIFALKNVKISFLPVAILLRVLQSFLKGFCSTKHILRLAKKTSQNLDLVLYKKKDKPKSKMSVQVSVGDVCCLSKVASHLKSKI